ncbi:Zinc finger, CCHC-type superfamily [Sesbania bispinosa]|nr:Zinc finger, CCHC-type superfamily [Sesbania bispinosa]
MASDSSHSNTTSAVTFTTVPLIPCEKLTGTSNYSSWAAAVQLWFQGQGRSDHLTKQAKDIPRNDQARWKQIDASLCSVLWFSIDVKLQPQYQAFTTCYDVWNKANKVYSNDVHCLYNVVSNLITVKLENHDIQTYLGKLDRLIADFDALMPFTNDADKHAEQRGKFFMVLALVGLPPEFDSVRNQILSGTVVPSYDTVSEQLLRLSVPHMFGHSPVPPTNSSAFYSHSSYRGGRGGICGGYRGQRPRCNFCQRYGHTEAECRTKARQQPKTANIAQVISPGASDEQNLQKSRLFRLR